MNRSDPASTFDTHAQVYELLVDWPRRLAREAPFYRRLFEQTGVRRVLDAACGTGHHANLFHGWGLEVEGADISPGMIAHCRRQFGEALGLRWAVRSFDQPVAAGVEFDAVICVGNSLALAGDQAAIDAAVGNFMAALRPGGVCIIGVLNLWSLAPGTTVWQKCLRAGYNGEDHVLLKALHRCGDRAYIDFVDLTLDDSGQALPRFDAAEFSGIDHEHLSQVARLHGASDVVLFGSYDGAPYDRTRSNDLLFTCRRGG